MISCALRSKVMLLHTNIIYALLSLVVEASCNSSEGTARKVLVVRNYNMRQRKMRTMRWTQKIARRIIQERT